MGKRLFSSVFRFVCTFIFLAAQRLYGKGYKKTIYRDNLLVFFMGGSSSMHRSDIFVIVTVPAFFYLKSIAHSKKRIDTHFWSIGCAVVIQKIKTRDEIARRLITSRVLFIFC